METKATLSHEQALEALNVLRSNMIATQSASWSNMSYPLVAILDAAGYELLDSTKEQKQEHLGCYGGAGGYPGHIVGGTITNPLPHPIGRRERELEAALRRIRKINSNRINESSVQSYELADEALKEHHE